MKNIGLHIFGQPLDARPRSAVQPSPIQIPVALLLRRPDNPEAPFAVASELSQKHIARRSRHGLRALPRLAVEAAHDDLAGLIAISDPGRPQLSIGSGQ